MSVQTETLRSFTVSKAVIVGLQIVGFAALTALCSHAKFYLPFTPVPITLQTLAVVLAGAMLGSKKGAASQLTLIGASLAGIPVFSTPGAVFGPTGGYILGFVLAAYVSGWMFERLNTKSFMVKFGLLFLASLFIFLPGVVWLKTLTGISFSKAIALGFTPFLIGDLIKTLIATLFLTGSEKIKSS